MPPLQQVQRFILIASTVLGSWLGMQAVHESGHVLGAWLTGGSIRQVVLHPLTISRTDLGRNPQPLPVVWAGPVWGVVLPLVLWGLAAAVRMPGAFVLRFFAGFCLVANGFYIGVGSFDRVGDCGVMLRHGSPMWTLWLFGAVCAPAGLCLWHGQSRHFGWGRRPEQVQPGVAYGTLAALVMLVVLGFVVDGT